VRDAHNLPQRNKITLVIVELKVAESDSLKSGSLIIKTGSGAGGGQLTINNLYTNDTWSPGSIRHDRSYKRLPILCFLFVVLSFFFD